MPAVLLPVLLVAHVTLAVGLLLPSLLLPFTLRHGRAARPAPVGATASATASGSGRGRFVRLLVWLQAHGTVALGAGVAATGAGLLAFLGAALLQRPWLLVALVIYAANLVLAFFVQRPDLRRLLGVDGGRFDDAVWAIRARRQRYVSYVMAGLVGTIGFLMSAKPDLW